MMISNICSQIIFSSLAFAIESETQFFTIVKSESESILPTNKQLYVPVVKYLFYFFNLIIILVFFSVYIVLVPNYVRFYYGNNKGSTQTQHESVSSTNIWYQHWNSPRLSRLEPLRVRSNGKSSGNIRYSFFNVYFKVPIIAKDIRVLCLPTTELTVVFVPFVCLVDPMSIVSNWL